MTRMTAEVTISKGELMKVLRAATINKDCFDPAPWSIWDAECLEAAAALIRREIAAADAERGRR